jgi:hypothetical protein
MARVYVLCKSGVDPQEFFPHETDWENPTPGVYSDVRANKKYDYERTEWDKVVTQEGLQGQSVAWDAAPPKYPPGKITASDCAPSILDAVEAHAQLMVFAVEPEGGEDLGNWAGNERDDRYTLERFTEIAQALIQITSLDERPLVTSALQGWRDNTYWQSLVFDPEDPEADPVVEEYVGTPQELYVALRNYTT